MSSDLHEQAMRAAERLRGIIVRLDNASVIRLELAARSMLENGCAVLPPPPEARALVTLIPVHIDVGGIVVGDGRTFQQVCDEVKAAVESTVEKALSTAATEVPA